MNAAAEIRTIVYWTGNVCRQMQFTRGKNFNRTQLQSRSKITKSFTHEDYAKDTEILKNTGN